MTTPTTVKPRADRRLSEPGRHENRPCVDNCATARLRNIYDESMTTFRFGYQMPLTSMCAAKLHRTGHETA